MPPQISIVPNSVRKVCQLTGETDRQKGQPAFNKTETNFRLMGTDLGSSFEHDGRLWFLFGDTWPAPSRPGDDTVGWPPPRDSDSVAWTTDSNPEPGIHLTFVCEGSKYKVPKLQDVDGRYLSTGAFEVPIAGFSANGKMYVFHSTDHFESAGGQGGLDAFWIGPDGAIGTSWANPSIDSGNWHPPFPITPPEAARNDSPIAAITRFDGALDVFWIGPDGAIGTSWANPSIDSGNWHPPFPITPPEAARNDSPIVAITRFDGALDVFWIGPDGAIGTSWANPSIDSGNWHPPFPITPPEAARNDSPIAAITRFDGALDVFWIGPDGAIGTSWANPSIDSGNWHPPFPITPPDAARNDSPIAAITRFDGALDVFWIGPDGAIGTSWANPSIDSGNWHPPFPITPPGAARNDSPIAAITRFDGALDVFWIGPDGAIGTSWANPSIDSGNWHPPFPITPPGAARSDSPIAAITRFDGALDVFWIGSDGTIGTTWANPSIDSGNWHPPFPITPPDAARNGSPIAAITRTSGEKRTLMGRTILAVANNNDPTDLRALYDFSRLDQGGRFINVACVIRDQNIDGLPFQGPALLAWGSGRYRDSDVYLACVPLADVRNQSAWRFLTDVQVGSLQPQWGHQQTAAVPLFLQRQVGELSVSWLEPLGLWLMLYNAESPRGINGRVAISPWGPWSEPIIVFDPGWPGLGYGHFMHIKDSTDGLSDPGREHEWGGEYGPYIIDRYTRRVGDQSVRQVQIYFVLSTWNPYNTVLMTATLQRQS